MTLSNERKKELLERKLEEYELQYYNMEIEIEVAEEIGNESRQDQLHERAVEIKKAMKLIEARIDELS